MWRVSAPLSALQKLPKRLALARLSTRLQHDAPRAGDFRGAVKNLLFYNRAPLVLGLCIGGLGASVAGAIYVHTYTPSVDLPQLLQVLQYKIEWQVAKPSGGAPDNAAEPVDDATPTLPFALPGSLSLRDVFPLITVAFWSIGAVSAFLFATGRTHLNLHFKQFMEHVNFSLNYIEGNTLKFRTIKECKLVDLLSDNSAAVDMILSSAKETCPKQPFLLLPRKYSAFVSNSILNTVSPAFTEGYFWAAQGSPVAQTSYWFALSFEKEATTVLKLRVMLCGEDVLRLLAAGQTPEFEQPIHRFRFGGGLHSGTWLVCMKIQNLAARMLPTFRLEKLFVIAKKNIAFNCLVLNFPIAVTG